MTPRAAAVISARHHCRTNGTAKPKGCQNNPSSRTNAPPSASFHHSQDESFAGSRALVETGDFADFNNSDYNGEAADQMLTEHGTNFSANLQDESFMQTPAAYAPCSAGFQDSNQDDPLMQISTTDSAYPPPQATEDSSPPLEMSARTSDSHVRGYRRTRRSRRAADPVEEPRGRNQNSKSRGNRHA